MKYRECAGGIIFRGEEVFLLRNDKKEWVFPKGVVRGGDLPSQTALNRVLVEAGLRSEILGEVGSTEYEFYSISRKQPVHNSVRWYAMTSDGEPCVDVQQGFVGGGWFGYQEALTKITYTQDRELLIKAWEFYQQHANA